MNQAQFAGRIGRDATLRETPSGKMALTFPLAVDVYPRDAEKGPMWVSCTLWGARAEKLHPYVTKGTQVAVSGEIILRSWEKNGRHGSAIELQALQLTLLGRPTPPPTSSPSASVGLAAVRQTPVPSGLDFNDDIPF
jgi:single-strand DNA-binding protein